MNVDVYDSYARNPSGAMLHFDVFVKEGTSPEQALNFGQNWLKSIGVPGEALEQRRCQFCHSEMANDAVEQTIEQDGFFILQMENCPHPYWK